MTAQTTFEVTSFDAGYEAGYDDAQNEIRVILESAKDGDALADVVERISLIIEGGRS